MIKIASEDVLVPGDPLFKAGAVYVVDEGIGKTLVSRGQAEEVKPPKDDAQETKPTKNKKAAEAAA